MTTSRTSTAVRRSLRETGEHLGAWRRLRHLTVAEVADRAGVAPRTVTRLEHGEGATLENTLRIARALGLLDVVTAAFDPFTTDVGRMRAQEALPARVRRAKQP